MTYPSAAWKPSGTPDPNKRGYVRGGQHGHPGSRQAGCPQCLAYYRQWKLKNRKNNSRTAPDPGGPPPTAKEAG